MSRDEAMANGLMFYFTGEPCKHGHIAERKVTNNTCQECQRLAYRNDTERYKKIQQKRRSTKKKEISRNISERWKRRKSTKEEKALRAAERRRNRSTRMKTDAKRRAQKLQAIPVWSDENIIKQIYADAVHLAKETGIKHHVHHIVPLQAVDSVSGLHTHDNLIILTEDEHKWFHAKPERLKLLW
jgi:flagellum-specific peptidoglycan hydrolase FlgJ